MISNKSWHCSLVSGEEEIHQVSEVLLSDKALLFWQRFLLRVQSPVRSVSLADAHNLLYVASTGSYSRAFKYMFFPLPDAPLKMM